MMTQIKKMLAIVDQDGRVVAAAHLGKSAVEDLNIGIEPLQGQTVHEIELPAPVTQLSGHDFHLLLSRARFEPSTAKLTFPEIHIESVHKK